MEVDGWMIRWLSIFFCALSLVAAPRLPRDINGTHLLDVPSGWVYVEWYGAATNNLDNSTNIQAALDAAGNGGLVRFASRGTYTNLSSLEFYPGQTLEGVSGAPQVSTVNGLTNQTRLYKASGSSPVLRPKLSGNTHAPVVRNLVLDGGYAVETVLDLTRVDHAALSRLYVTGGKLGILVDSSGGQAYFNWFNQVSLGYLTSYGISFTNGANDNTYVAGFLGGTPTNILNSSASAANCFIAAHLQGVGGANPTSVHVYNDGGPMKLVGCYLEQASVYAIYDVNSTTDNVDPTWGGSIAPNFYFSAANSHAALRFETRPGGTQSFLQVGKFVLENTWNTGLIQYRFYSDGPSYASSGVQYQWGYGDSTVSVHQSGFYEGTTEHARIDHRSGAVLANEQLNGGYIGNYDLRLRRASSTKWQLADASNNDADAAVKDLYPSGVAVSKLLRTDSGGKLAAVTVGSGLSFDGTTVSASGGSLTVAEVDGAPSVASVSTLKFTNGTVTDNGGGTVTVTVTGGSGDSVTVNTANATDADFTDTSTLFWVLDTAASPDTVKGYPTNIANAQISASAAIARSKVAAGTANHVVINDGSGNLSSEATLGAARFPALTGDVTTAGGSLATTIAADAVALGADTTGNYVASSSNGAGVSGASASTEGGTIAPAWDPISFVNNITMWDASQASRTWTANLSGATDPQWTYGNNSADLSTGVLKNGGSQVAVRADNLSVFAATTSAQLRGVLSDEIGTGAAMFTRVGVYREIFIGAGAMAASTTNGAASGTFAPTGADNTTWDAYDFDDTTSESVQFNWAMPDEWDLGTVKLKFYWTTASGTGNVRWGVKAGAIGDNGTVGTALGTEVTVDDARQADNVVHISSATSAVTVGNTPALGKLVQYKLRRDPSVGTNKAGDARLLGIVIQYNELTTEQSLW
jgi:hypothetical protein